MPTNGDTDLQYSTVIETLSHMYEDSSTGETRLQRGAHLQYRWGKLAAMVYGGVLTHRGETQLQRGDLSTYKETRLRRGDSLERDYMERDSSTEVETHLWTGNWSTEGETRLQRGAFCGGGLNYCSDGEARLWRGPSMEGGIIYGGIDLSTVYEGEDTSVEGKLVPGEGDSFDSLTEGNYLWRGTHIWRGRPEGIYRGGDSSYGQ